MKIKLSAEGMAREVLGKVVFLGCEQRKEYDQAKREYTDKVVSTTVHLGCEKLENSIDVQVESDEFPTITKFGEVSLLDLEYDPYASVNSFEMNGKMQNRGVVNERFRCKRVMAAMKGSKNPVGGEIK